MELDLKKTWINIAGENENSIKIFDEIINTYKSPGRYYHTVDHLFMLTDQFKRISQFLKDQESVNFAAFYHDLIYVPFRFDNEIKSANRAVSDLTKLGKDKKLINKTEYMIICTRDHLNPLNDRDTDIFLDCDLLVLASEKENYLKYLEKLRNEYSKISEKTYFRGRLNFIAKFLNRPRIFKTPAFYNSYEKPARQNLEMEKQNISKLA